MLTYVAKRLALMALILLAASFLVYNLVALSGDPLAEFRESSMPNKYELMQARSDLLQLNVPAPLRYFIWLSGTVTWIFTLGQAGTLGVNIQRQEVSEQLGTAVAQTLSLVVAAVILSIVIGVTLGIISALRQYSVLDHATTFMVFLFFSLPIFWIAVLLKEYGAIGFNNFLRYPVISPPAMLAVSILFAAVVFMVCSPENWKRRILMAGLAFSAAAVVLSLLSVTRWFANPGLGIAFIALCGAGAAVSSTAFTLGLGNRKGLYSSLGIVAIAVAFYFPLQYVFDGEGLKLGPFSLGQGWVLTAAAAAVSAIGYLIAKYAGGDNRGRIARTTVFTGLFTLGLIVLDRFMQAWPLYSKLRRGRPIATTGTPTAQQDFWLQGLDAFSHLVLPTTALLLLFIATYTRYSRAAMLEVMGMDYVRTARAKGVPERSVIVKHAFRNALIPVVTVVAMDIGSIFGGAVVAETVFDINGMGKMFISGINATDLNVVMGFFLVAASATLVCNLVADLLYSALDPRVRTYQKL